MKKDLSGKEISFDFGENWKAFSEKALTPERVKQAKEDFLCLLGTIDIQGETFLDIGFGQGLSLLTATSLGAKVTGLDINAKCKEVLESNRKFFDNIPITNIPVFIGSILDENIVKRLSEHTKELYSIVQSWGVLHHTGNMKQAIKNAASLVKPGGYLIISIYQKHWTSPLWSTIKLLYNFSPLPVKKSLAFIFYPLIYIAKLTVTGSNPLKQARGMDFYFNLIDWLGGYPYEYASIDEIKSITAPLGFECIKIIPAEVPTGCNEFVFRKIENS